MRLREAFYLEYGMRAGRRGVHVSGVLRPISVTIIKSFKDVLCRFGLQSNDITHTHTIRQGKSDKNDNSLWTIVQ